MEPSVVLGIEIRSADEYPTLIAARALIRAQVAASSETHDETAIEGMVDSLPAPYVPPRGGLWVAWQEDQALGCVALQELGTGVAEIKRMYVRPHARLRGIGLRLARFAVAHAQELGYAKVRLGTLTTARAAQALYASLGFRRIDSYRTEDFGTILFYELKLTH